MGIDAFIFDFDGVIADSVNIKTMAFASLFEEFGEKVVSEVVDYHLKNGGVTRAEKFVYYYERILNRPIDDKICSDLSSRFSKIVVEKIIEAPEIEGAESFINKCWQDIPCFINSATPDDELGEIVKGRSLSHYFKDVFGSGSSKKENCKKIIEKYSFDPSKVFFFGDAVSDYKASLSCGTCFIGIVEDINNSSLIDFAPEIKWFNNFTDINLDKLE